MSKQFGQVALLLGGSSPEREISLRSGAMVAQALEECCEQVISFDPAQRELNELEQIKPERIFIILHGGAGENGEVQEYLTRIGLPYTGSLSAACALAMDKNKSLTIWNKAGLPTGKWRTADVQTTDEQLAAIASELGLPVFVKPNAGGSSVACARVSDHAQLRAAVDNALTCDSQALIEPLFVGDELTYGILDNRSLPGIMVKPAGSFYDYEAKYESDLTEYLCPPPFASEREDKFRALAEKAFTMLGCRSWGRVDFMVRDDECKLLEVNTVPGMTSHSLVPKAAAKEGISYSQLIARILEDAQC